MKIFFNILYFFVHICVLHAAGQEVKVSGEKTINDLLQVKVSGKTCLDLHKVVIKSMKNGEGSGRKSRDDIIKGVSSTVESLLKASTSIQAVNFFEMIVDYKMRLGGYRFGSADITKDVLEELKKLCPSVVLTNDPKLEFTNLGPFGKKVLASTRTFRISKGIYETADLLYLKRLTGLKGVILDDVTFCLKCKSIYIKRKRLPEELMLRGVNGRFEEAIQSLRSSGINVHGTAMLRQESSYLGWPKEAPPSISVCKVRLSEYSEEPPVFIEGSWDDREESVFNRYSRERPSWWSIQSVEVDQGLVYF